MRIEELVTGRTYATKIGRRLTVVEVEVVLPAGSLIVREVASRRGHVLLPAKLWYEVRREPGHPTRWERVRRLLREEG